MAEESTTARKRPGANGKKEKAPQKVSKYHVYSENGKGVLTPIGEFDARNAEHAVASFIETPGEHGELAEKVKIGEAGLTVVPERNLSRVKAQVETRTRVKLSVA